MNWQRIGPYVLDAGNGYRVCKSSVAGVAQYRASHGGGFIGQAVASVNEAKTQAQQHMANQ